MAQLEQLKYWAKRLTGIPSHPENSRESRITRGESISASQHTQVYVEQDPTVREWLQDNAIPTRRKAVGYFRNLLPFLQWLPNYNMTWFLGDVVAGITVGAVVVPQGMAYAKIANLAPQFGLYSSFVGVLLYFPFATSKDITIGPVAVMSLLTGQIITHVRKQHPKLVPNEIASVLAVLCGAFVFVLGILRLGFIVDFIPLPAIGAFMTGSALNIAIGQVPALMGITGFDTRAATYHVFINILKHLGRTQIDAALGLTALFLLYAIRYFCNWQSRRDPPRAKLYFFISTLRNAFTILLYVFVSWLVNRHRKKKPRFSILGTVPRGFKNMRVPKVGHTIVSAVAYDLPGAIIVLLIEHIAIAKSFGRVNNYTISPSQELIAIGVTNLIGPFFGAYPATGSFSRTAIKSKAGVRTPLAGLITALVVLLAIYALPPLFFYIPNAALSAVIIHAVGDLITPPKALYHWWQVSPPEVIIYFAGVIGTVFGTIEDGIYTAIAATGGLLLFRIAKSRGDFLGRVEIWTNSKFSSNSVRSVYMPLDHADGSNPGIPVEEPLPGVFIYRVRQSPLYPSIGPYTDQLVQVVQMQTKRTNPNSFPTLGDRPWNLLGPRHIDPNAFANDPRPTLKAIILDFSAVEHVDVTSIQILQDIRQQLDRHASPHVVEWHFAAVSRPWVKRGLVAGGFGHIQTPENVERHYSIAKITDSSDANEVRKEIEKENELQRRNTLGDDIEVLGVDKLNRAVSSLPVISVDREAFHIDVPAAVASVQSRYGRPGDLPYGDNFQGEPSSGSDQDVKVPIA